MTSRYAVRRAEAGALVLETKMRTRLAYVAGFLLLAAAAAAGFDPLRDLAPGRAPFTLLYLAPLLGCLAAALWSQRIMVVPGEIRMERRLAGVLIGSQTVAPPRGAAVRVRPLGAGRRPYALEVETAAGSLVLDTSSWLAELRALGEKAAAALGGTFQPPESPPRDVVRRSTSVLPLPLTEAHGMERVRTAIIGYGRNGSTMHAGAVEGNPDFVMAAVCDIDSARREEARARFGCAVHEDYRRMLREQELDLVCVVTRSDQHAAMVCDCLEAGVNVLVTKPWALDLREAERMVRARDRSGKLLLPWLPARWGCDFVRVRDLVRSGAIGRVFYIRRVVSSFGIRNDWQIERKHGGGYLLNWGPHIIDPPILLAGGRPRTVFGALRQTINPGDVEDMFVALLTMPDGTIVQAEYAVSAEEPPAWFLQGTAGTIVVRGSHLVLNRAEPVRPDDPTSQTMAAGGARITEEELHGNPYGDEHEIYREIARTMRGEPGYPVRAEDALELTRVLDAVRASDAQGQVVAL